MKYFANHTYNLRTQFVYFYHSNLINNKEYTESYEIKYKPIAYFFSLSK